MARGEYTKYELDNGTVLVTEHHPHVGGVSIGVWIRVGSSYENSNINGISHFIEHTVFRGTEMRSALEIATALEAVGGDLNAFTDREFTCYHATILKEHVDLALDVLSDLVYRPTFLKEEIEKERRVLLQEMSMVEESPDDWLGDLFFQAVWRGEPLGMSILGNRRTVHRLTRGRIKRYFADHYRPENMVISIAGNFERQEILKKCQEYFGRISVQKSIPLKLMKAHYHCRHKSILRNTEQLHLMVGFEGVGFKHPDRFNALVLSYFLGGGMSSRLLQEIREKAALAYTVECDCIPFIDTGLFTIYCATSHRAFSKAQAIIRKEIRQLKKEPIKQEQLDNVKGQLKGMILLASDYIDNRQESVGRNELIFGRYLPVEEVIGEINRVSAEGVHALCKRLLVREKESVMTLGKRKFGAEQLSLFH